MGHSPGRRRAARSHSDLLTYARSVNDLRMLHAGLVDYQDAWDEQRRVHAARVAGDVPDTVLLLEHPPVYTAGKRTLDIERPVDGTPVVDVDRGGKITWHGPGPARRLPDRRAARAGRRRRPRAPGRGGADPGLRGPRRSTPAGSRAAPASGLRDDRGERKVAAIGIRVSQGVTMHGFALNCDCDLTWFDRIVPCGITDATVTSLTAELGRPVTRDGRHAVRREAARARCSGDLRALT